MLITKKEFEREVLWLKFFGLTEDEIQAYLEFYDIEVIKEIKIWN